MNKYELFLINAGLHESATYVVAENIEKAIRIWQEWRGGRNRSESMSFGGALLSLDPTTVRHLHGTILLEEKA